MTKAAGDRLTARVQAAAADGCTLLAGKLRALKAASGTAGGLGVVRDGLTRRREGARRDTRGARCPPARRRVPEGPRDDGRHPVRDGLGGRPRRGQGGSRQGGRRPARSGRRGPIGSWTGSRGLSPTGVFGRPVPARPGRRRQAPCRRPVPDPVRPARPRSGPACDSRGHARAPGASPVTRGGRTIPPRFRSAPHSGWARLTVRRASAMVRRSSSLRGSSITMHRARRSLWAAGIFSLLAAMLPFVAAAPVLADTGATVPAGFQDEVVLTGLDHPMSIVFAPNGNVFVAEKRGVIKFYTSLADTTPTVFADLNTNVHNYWDRGLMGLAVDPGYPTRPYVYVLYAYNHIIGDASPAPRWPSADALVPPGSKYDDRCPNPPQATVDGCVVSGRLSRLTVSGGVMSGSEHVLIEDWCQQFPSHSVGSLAFGPEGALYASGGEGASFNGVAGLRPARRHAAGHADAGQPVRRPGRRRTRSPPTAEGGALRSQDMRTSGDPAGARRCRHPDRSRHAAPAGPTTPTIGASDANARRIIAYGLRNPYRFTIKPGDRRDLDRRRRLQHLGGARTGCRSRRGPTQLRLAVLRGRGDPAGLRRPGAVDLRRPQRRRDVTLPYYTYNHSASVVAGRRLRRRQLLDLGPRLPARRRARIPPPTTARCS